MSGNGLNVVALCPTFRHPELLANSLALWNLQAYPARNRLLVILDDGQTFDGQQGKGWQLHSPPTRLPSLPTKYNWMLANCIPPNADAILVWEDDDIYLPDYISAHVAALESAQYSKPNWVLSDYTGKIAVENATGRFHSTIGARLDLLRSIGGWPDTKRADFDQQLMAKLHARANRVAQPWPQSGPIPFVYSWHTGAAHCQSTMRSPDDETWYDRGEEAYAKVPFVGILKPKMDERTKRIFSELRIGTEALQATQ